MTDFATHIAEDSRLIILRALASETSQTLNEVLLHRTLETFGHNRTRDFTRTQMRALAELGAVTLRETGAILIAAITRAGLDHVERRAILAGVARPSPLA